MLLTPAQLAQLVACLWLGVGEFAGSIPWLGTFFHWLSVTVEKMSTEYWLTAYVKPAKKKCGYGK